MSSFSEEEIKRAQKIAIQSTRKIMEQFREVARPILSKLIDEVHSSLGEGCVVAILSACSAEIGSLAISIVDGMPVEDLIKAISDATMQRYVSLKEAIKDHEEKEHLKNFVKTFVDKHKSAE